LIAAAAADADELLPEFVALPLLLLRLGTPLVAGAFAEADEEGAEAEEAEAEAEGAEEEEADDDSRFIRAIGLGGKPMLLTAAEDEMGCAAAAGAREMRTAGTDATPPEPG
jgi:hypothetical protein